MPRLQRSFRVAFLAAISATLFDVGCAPSAATDEELCARAAERLAACTGMPAQVPSSCTAAQAEEILAMSCDDFGGAADWAGDLWDSFFGSDADDVCAPRSCSEQSTEHNVALCEARGYEGRVTFEGQVASRQTSKTWADGSAVESYLLHGSTTLPSAQQVSYESDGEIAELAVWTGPNSRDNYLRLCLYPYQCWDPLNEYYFFDIYNCVYATEQDLTAETAARYAEDVAVGASVTFEITTSGTGGQGRDFVGVGCSDTNNAGFVSFEIGS